MTLALIFFLVPTSTTKIKEFFCRSDRIEIAIEPYNAIYIDSQLSNYLLLLLAIVCTFGSIFLIPYWERSRNLDFNHIVVKRILKFLFLGIGVILFFYFITYQSESFLKMLVNEAILHCLEI